MHYALAMTLHRGDFRLDDTELQEEGVIRIYDILFADKVLLDTDAFVRECLKDCPTDPFQLQSCTITWEHSCSKPALTRSTQYWRRLQHGMCPSTLHPRATPR